MTGYQFPESNHVIKVFDKNVTCQENATWTELPDACEGESRSAMCVCARAMRV